MKFIDLFSGIGGFRLALESFGLACVYSNEIDENACVTYQLNFGCNPKGDMTKVDAQTIPDHDILCAGFPCQAFSIAGYRQGFNDNRGKLFYTILDVIQSKKPKILFLENVKNLISHDKHRTFKIILQLLEDEGYHVKYQILNTCDYSHIPQNRERIYILGFLNKDECLRFNFPSTITNTLSVKSLLCDHKLEDKYYYNHKPLYEKLKDSIVDEGTVYQWRRKYVRENKSNVCPTLTANMGMGGHNVPIIKDSYGIRKLTPRECLNLQGFSTSYMLPNIANSHLYKQIGNSVSVPIIKRITENIVRACR